MRCKGKPYTLSYIYTLKIVDVLSAIMSEYSNATKEIRELEITCTTLVFQSFLKEQSRPSVSNVTSADVRLTTGLGSGQFCNVIG